MAVSESLSRGRVTVDDIAGALALSGACGWNQTAEDWAVFIAHGQVQGIRDAAGLLVATAAALPYGGGQGWISMVLVDPTWRHRGLATELLNDCVDSLRQAGVTPVLDATPAGAPVYRRLGFVPGLSFERWEAELAPTAAAEQAGRSDIGPAGAADIDQVCALDASASLVERRFLLEAFLSRSDTRAWMAHDAQGFVVLRAGLRAAQIGPLVAPDEPAAIALLATALAGLHGRVFLDVPTRWTALTAALQSRGFRQQRPFQRMALGDARSLAGSARLFVVAGPEFG